MQSSRFPAKLLVSHLLVLTSLAAMGLAACRGESPVDSDGDDWLDQSDCAPHDPNIYPTADEHCGNGLDDDCDGFTDEVDGAVDALSYYIDHDGDGFGDPTTVLSYCADPGSGFSADNTDCDDNNPLLNPETAWYADGDADGYGAGEAVSSCAPYSEAGSGVAFVQQNGDCDDELSFVSPVGVETCNSLDDDCDGVADDGVTTRYYTDSDGDGYGDPSSYTDDCYRPEGTAETSDDCDDLDDSIHPDAPRICNDGIDNACDGTVEDWLPCSATSGSADVTLLGSTEFEYSGSAISDLGDLDGDGRNELLIGATEYLGMGMDSSEGGAWLVWSDTSYSGGLTLGDPSSTRTLLLDGVAAGDKAGVDVAGVGDMDGDSIPDLVVTAYSYDSPATSSHTAAGGAFLFSGASMFDSEGVAVTGRLSLADADTIYYGGFQADWLGEDTAAGGDLNGDGLTDLLVGARGRAGGGENDAGTVFIAYGAGDMGPGGSVNNLGGSLPGAILEGEPGGNMRIGRSMVGNADFNGDGQIDIAVGHDKYEGEQGGVYAVTHSVSGTESLADADVFLEGDQADSICGWVVRAYDGPAGYSNLLIGCPHEDDASKGAGSVLVVEGSVTFASLGWTNTVDVAATRYTGAQPEDGFGWAMDVGGDVNGDGEADLVVGATGDSAGYYGQARVFYGPLVQAGAMIAAVDADVVLQSTDILSLFGTEMAFVGPQGGVGDAIAIGASQYDVVTDEDTYVDRGAVHIWSAFTAP